MDVPQVKQNFCNSYGFVRRWYGGESGSGEGDDDVDHEFCAGSSGSGTMVRRWRPDEYDSVGHD